MKRLIYSLMLSFLFLAFSLPECMAEKPLPKSKVQFVHEKTPASNETLKELSTLANLNRTYIGSSEIQTSLNPDQTDHVPGGINTNGIKVVPSSGSYLGGCNTDDYFVEISGACIGNGWDISSVTICGVEVCHIMMQSSNVVVVYPNSGNPGIGDIVITSKSKGITTIKNGFTYQVPVPVNQAKDIQFSNISATSSSLSWTRGSGDSCVVFMKKGITDAISPSDQKTYSAVTVFGKGTQIGSSGWYCVYNGNKNSVSVTGLTPETAYTTQVFEYNGSSGIESYLNIPSTDNPKLQPPYTISNDNHTVDNNTLETMERSKY